MLWIVTGLLLLAVIAGPGLWVRRVLQRYSQPADRYRREGTGGELARHLLDRFGLQDVGVEETRTGDHYDPQARKVRLSPENFNSHSLTAVTVATHEVGHAIQHSRGEVLFNYRQRLVRAAMTGERIGSVLLVAAPVIFLVTRLPQAGLLMLLAAVATMGLGTLVHLVTLPVEIDASFAKALPILENGNYLHNGDLPHARRILTAAALTYVAGSLASLLNLGRWLMVLRR
jgi:Zn-dependent membrane protease YugP